MRGHRRTPPSRAPPALPNSSVRASLYIQGAQQAQIGLRDTTAGRLCRSPARLGPLSQGNSGRRWMDEGLNSSPLGIWHLKILSQSRRHTHAA